MKLTDMAIGTETISVLHPDLGDVGLTVELHHPMSREYNAALARLVDSSERDNLTVAIMAAEAATIAINDGEGYQYDPENSIYRDSRYFWLALAVYSHIAKKKASSEAHLSS